MASKRVETDGSRNYYLIGAALGACLYFFQYCQVTVFIDLLTTVH